MFKTYLLKNISCSLELIAFYCFYWFCQGWSQPRLESDAPTEVGAPKKAKAWRNHYSQSNAIKSFLDYCASDFSSCSPVNHLQLPILVLLLASAMWNNPGYKCLHWHFHPKNHIFHPSISRLFRGNDPIFIGHPRSGVHRGPRHSKPTPKTPPFPHSQYVVLGRVCRHVLSCRKCGGSSFEFKITFGEFLSFFGGIRRTHSCRFDWNGHHRRTRSFVGGK